MSRRTRVFIGVFVVYLAAVGFMLTRVAADLDPRYRESAEESLVDTAHLLATLLERKAFDGIIPIDDLERTLRELQERPLSARIFDFEKTKIDLHVYVTDREGIVLFDSRGVDLGADYAAWRDVALTLQGRYGARTTLADPADPKSAVMYVGAAIREDGRGGNGGGAASDDIIGMVAVGKPIAAIRPFIANAREKLVIAGLLSTAAFALALLLVIVWLVRPFGLLRDVWRAVRREGGSPVALARRVADALRTAFAEARDTLVGRSYVDQYVQTLAHELKSPLAGIRGAAELLREPMPEDTRARFIGNIEEQVGRASDLIERMLELSSLERRSALDHVEPVALAQVARTVQDELAPVATARAVTLVVDIAADLTVAGDAFLLGRALSNLARNAVDFAPRDSTVELAAQDAGHQVRLTVRDHGAGLPEFARDRVFEKFFSLPRPATGRKGTGLGLAFVREVAQLHGGSVRLTNHPDGGALATLTLPRPATR